MQMFSLTKDRKIKIKKEIKTEKIFATYMTNKGLVPLFELILFNTQDFYFHVIKSIAFFFNPVVIELKSMIF